MLSKSDMEMLNNKGWIQLRNESEVSKEKLIAISKGLGEPKASRKYNDVIDVLVPVSQEKSLPKSLSSIYGKGEFPFHTDTAHWKIPARYIILHANKAGSSSRPTLLLDYLSLKFDLRIIEILHRGVFKIVNGRNSFLTNLLELGRDGQFLRVRFDRNCMFPVNQSAIEAYTIFTETEANATVTEVKWEDNDVLIIDNWRMLHRRGLPKNENAEERILERVLVEYP